MADSPTFSISNSFEREQQSLPGDWDIIDTYSQDYNLGWNETYSSRLSVNLNFGVKLEDTIRSLGVDNKTVTLKSEADLASQIWDLGFNLGDTIDYSNEFNNPRRDEIEYGADFNFNPLYFPPLKIKLQRIWDKQDLLEDKTSEKFEATTDYSIGDSFDFSLAWRETIEDDRLLNDSDSDVHGWDADFNYSRTLLPTLKLDLKTNYSGNKEETLNNAGVVLSTQKERDLQNNLKFSFDTWPNISSTFEIISREDFIVRENERDLNFTVSSSQGIVNLGTLSEKLEIKRNDLESSTADNQQNDLNLLLELAGAPQKYTDYSIKYELNLSKVNDNLNPGSDTDNREDALDISLTAVPNEKITVESSFNLSNNWVNGSKAGSERKIKIKGSFEGEMLNIPNLVFTPKLESNNEEDFVKGTRQDSLDLVLNFLYSPTLLHTISWDLEADYNWNDGNSEQSDLDFTSDFEMEIPNIAWDLSIKEKSSTTFDFSSNEPNFWEHELRFAMGNDLTDTISFDADFGYQYFEDDQDSDDLTLNIDWAFLESALSFSFKQDRVFEGPKDVNRTYSADFSMIF